jgi:hypothetical protein
MIPEEAAKKIIEYFNTEPEWKPGQSASDIPEVVNIIEQVTKEKNESLKWWLETYDITMPCGHKNRYLAQDGNGTQYCALCINNKTMCAYCGHVHEDKNNLIEIFDHVMTCEKRPEKKLLEKAFEIEDNLFGHLEHLSKYGYRPENCETCEIIQVRLDLWGSK